MLAFSKTKLTRTYVHQNVSIGEHIKIETFRGGRWRRRDAPGRRRLRPAWEQQPPPAWNTSNKKWMRRRGREMK